jgi:hypothetical protein
MNKDIPVVKKYMQIMSSAFSRNLEFDISFSDFKKIYNKKRCAYTDIPLIHGIDGNYSIDRIDSSKGYIKGNLIACDVKFNQKKSNISINEIKKMYLVLLKYNLL